MKTFTSLYGAKMSGKLSEMGVDSQNMDESDLEIVFQKNGLELPENTDWKKGKITHKINKEDVEQNPREGLSVGEEVEIPEEANQGEVDEAQVVDDAPTKNKGGRPKKQ